MNQLDDRRHDGLVIDLIFLLHSGAGSSMLDEAEHDGQFDG